MADILGFAYFVFGGMVTGRTLYAMHLDGTFEVDEGKERPLVGMLLLAALFWLAWPVVWGVVRATRQALRGGKDA